MAIHYNFRKTCYQHVIENYVRHKPTVNRWAILAAGPYISLCLLGAAYAEYMTYAKATNYTNQRKDNDGNLRKGNHNQVSIGTMKNLSIRNPEILKNEVKITGKDQKCKQ